MEKAELDLSYTRITAPVDGMVGERALRVGAYVNPGARLLSVVPLEQAYVVGNFQETQLTHVQPGQPVSISVDTFAGETLKGHVQSIAPATGVTFAAVKPDNATGNFSYTPTNPTLTGLDYKIMTSTDLVNWVEDTAATAGQTVSATSGDKQTMSVTLSGAPLTEDKIFVRVLAE